MNSKFKWQRYPGNPVFPVMPGTWMEDQTANPDLLLIEDSYFMYFRGQQGGHDRIGLATIPKKDFDGKTWKILPKPIIDVGKPGDPDETHVLDPASVLVDDKIYLYYSAVSPTCDRSVCLATSKDGIHFKKHSQNPIVIGGGPEIVFKNGRFYLYYWQPARNDKGFEIHLSASSDGFHFEKISDDPVLPVGAAGSWDSHTVETPRIFKEDDLYYMIYCGSGRYEDYPWHAGLATSRDLIHWKKFNGNPIFSRGEQGQWDEGAIWFTTVEKIDGIYYMWYEGYGGGTARWEPYGTYLKGAKSQVGMATLKADLFYVGSN
jgi:predicted GH43/DUF377 family glycosyl hydrolase